MPSLRTADAELHYEERGQGDPVVLLHGLGSSTEDWEPQIAALAPRYRVIAIDMRGSGRSRDLTHPGGPFSIATFAADTVAVIDHLGAAPAHIVGLSMGGMVAFQLAVDHARVVRTMTIINSGPALVPRGWQEHAMIATRLALAATWGPKGMAKLLAPKLFPDNAQLRRTFRERMARNDRQAYAATQRAAVGFDVVARIGTIEAPALIVASDHDYTPVARKQGYARLMRNARVVVVPDSRHALPIEDPRKLQPILDAFLEEHRNTRGGQDHAASR
ncbi:MAG TPA: alpha/beta fold hydrolase [Kofleriaceae bacterium]